MLVSSHFSWLIAIMTRAPTTQPQDKYVLRMPDGLRDRIKAYAERHGRSMNAEIVRILEREFPAPWPIESRIGELMDMVEVLKGAASNEAVDRLLHEIEETINGIVTGRVKGLDEHQRQNIRRRFDTWHEQRAESSSDYAPELDPEERDTYDLTWSTAKNVEPFGD